MKLRRSVCLAGLVALGAWSVAACSSDTVVGNEDGGSVDETGGAGSGGKGGAAGSAGKAGGGGTAGKGGSSGSAGKAGAAGTAGADGGGFDTDGGEPAVKITEPKTGSTVGPGAAYPDYPDVPIAYKVGNFALRLPGTPTAQCPLGSCGHVHINVDGKDCNDVASGFPYNAAGIASPIDIGLDYCKAGVAGVHTVTISLHNTDHSAVNNKAGDPIEDSITITALPESGEGGVPEGGTPAPDAGDAG